MMEVDLDQGPDADAGDHLGCALRRTYRLGSLLSLPLAVPFVHHGGNDTLAQFWNLWVGSKVMNGLKRGYFSHYCGYPQSKRVRIIGNELHANEEQALEQHIMRKVKAYVQEEG
jgi:hypothetical protein